MNRAKHQQSAGDKSLLAGLRRGESSAVRAWFREYEKPLLRFVLSKVSKRTDAEEIVQDTFLNCLKHLPHFRGEASIKTWMWRIASHEVADYFRKKYAKRALKTFPMGELILAAPVRDAHETAEDVRLVLSRMRARYSELLLLKYVDRLQVREIARQLERSEKAVESDLFRARTAFKQEYAALLAEYGS